MPGDTFVSSVSDLPGPVVPEHICCSWRDQHHPSMCGTSLPAFCQGSWGSPGHSMCAAVGGTSTLLVCLEILLSLLLIRALRHVWLDSGFSSCCSQYHTCACRCSCCHLQSEPLGPVYTEVADLTQLVPGDPPPAFQAAEMLTVKALLLQSDRQCHTVLRRHFCSCL